ncbi:uncharacterized protein LOC126836646 [Adelges cooleyi]|uniref:uncharacterized protein LOC126836646 n=1 Tax=Adelges cooleyi TaxID=133065 RepID=UPI00217FDE46|nr:uncharacterized protein LOC126836646 [Adelges cooleyi]
MKLLCILITLAIVNVSPIMTAEYANSVRTTNKYIRAAFDADPTGLERAISNIVKDDDITIDTLNLMLVTPEKANFWFTIEHDEPFINNLPEHIAIADQVAVQKAISQVTRIPVPQLGPNENFENDSLARLGQARRCITGKVTKKLLIAAIDEGTPEFPNFTKICRLIAVARSMEFPDLYIKTASVDQAGHVCTLTSQNDNRFLYIPYNGFIAQVWPVGPDPNEYVNVLEVINDWYEYIVYCT